MKDVPLLRNSERNDFRRCPQRWHWRWDRGLVPVEISHGPLVFGTFGHLALAEYYGPGGFKRGPHPAETWDEITKGFMDGVRSDTTGYLDEDIEGTWEDARTLGHNMLVAYVEEYGDDSQWEVLWVESPFGQYIPHPRDIGKAAGDRRAIVKYVGTIDLIVRDLQANGRIRYVDHKFMKTIEKRHLWIDSQNGGYLAIGTHKLRNLGIIGRTESIRDLTYNFLRKAKQDERQQNKFGEYLNKDGSVSKKQPPPYFQRVVIERTAAERNRQVSNIGEEALAMKAFRDGKLKLFKNPTRDCAWDCSFFTLCGIHEAGGDVAGTIKVMYRADDPYAEYKGEDSGKRLERRLNE